ncbi:SRPBCC family protein [Baekduia soli]|uniref:SRPBCC family protein n=1 Tax=Baekduia soli TaxID=496014 RepID=A0A5B8U1X1_9ACTN|nr:SRPBCC family protein [Baekduia soli]QEC46950.1 SRPBCC family protein [Baekduia soli]
MLRYTAPCSAPPEVAWALIARPEAWPAWAPHIRGAWGLGESEVQEGARGAARLLGVVPVPVRVTAKVPGRSWTWRVGGLVEMDHTVTPGTHGGCTVAVVLRAPGPVEAALRVGYGPAVALLVANLARAAGREVSRSARARPRPTGTGSPPG